MTPLRLYLLTDESPEALAFTEQLRARQYEVDVHTGTLREFCLAMVADGLHFCLSQFEPGPEIESLVEQLPLSLVKLAGKYSTGALSSAIRDELKVIIDRAHRRSLEVIGHGVEDSQAAATLDFDFNQAVL